MPSHMVTTVTSPATASRELKASSAQRVSEIILLIGIVGGVAAAAGPIWYVRLGVAVAVTAALAACALAWRDLNTARHAHGQAMLEAIREHGAALSEERTRNAAVVDTLGARISDAGKVIERQRRTIAEQRMQLSTLKVDRAYLMGELEHRDLVISAIRETVREREAELIAVASEEPDAEIHHMQRRLQAAQELDWDEALSDEALSAESLPAEAVPA
jgi:chromosome segregation ATPase